MAPFSVWRSKNGDDGPPPQPGCSASWSSRLHSAPITRCESSSIGAVFASRRQEAGGSRVDARRRPCDDEDRTSSQRCGRSFPAPMKQPPKRIKRMTSVDARRIVMLSLAGFVVAAAKLARSRRGVQH
ncbi:hypothetical protein ACCO45_006273 [Purpureocillium lilacinum]|uniref:Uncharacterized protein n=1 Tax=Purpureocillium lilacinum TaxID=33203 RepID=A0ACC4DXP7_PURLI